MDYGFTGAGISGANYYDPTGMAASHITNYNNPNMYSGHGGLLSTPNGAAWGGPWQTYLTSQFAPEVAFAYLGQPLSGTNDPTPAYNLFIASTQAGVAGILGYHPFQNDLDISTLGLHIGAVVDGFSVGDNLTFAGMASPTNAGSYATTAGQLPDATTYYYYVVATNNNGFASLRSPEIAVTTGSTSSKNRIRLQWNRVGGATGYTVCRGSTSGSELQIYQNPGGFNGNQTYFDDMGNLTPSGTCPGGSGTAARGGIEQASYIGVNSPGTGYEVKIVAPSGYTANQTFTLPATGGTLAAPMSGTTGSIGGSALTSGTCASGTATITGATTSMAVVASPVTYPGDAYTWKGYVSATGTVTVKGLDELG